MWGLSRLLDCGPASNYSWGSEFLHCIITSVLSCQVKSWVSRLFMTICFIPKFILATIREWRTATKLLGWEMWVPDYDEERERVFNRRRD